MADGDTIKRRLVEAFALRKSRGDTRSHEELARAIEAAGGFRVTKSTVDNWAAGQDAPRAHKLAAIATVLGRPPEWFLVESETEAALIADLATRLAVLGELLEPFLDGEPMPRDPAAVQALGRALGRRPKGSPRSPSQPAKPDKQ